MFSLQSISMSEFILSRVLLGSEKGVTKSSLKQTVKEVVTSQLSDSELASQIDQSIDRLLHQSFVEEVSRSRYRVTDSGSQQLLKLLGLEKLPTRIQWSTFKNVYWIAYAFQLEHLPVDERKRLSDVQNLRAAILNRCFDLPTPPLSPLTAARNALLWRQLCDPAVSQRLQEKLPQLCQQAFNQGSVMGVLLSDLLEAPKPLAWEMALRQLVARQIGARRTDPSELRSAILRRALVQEQPESGGPLLKLPLEKFAQGVLEAATNTEEKFGERKVFIYKVWETLKQRDVDGELPLEDFKQKLIEATREGLISLSRADLSYTQNQADVAASETTNLNAAYHFVNID